MHVYLNFVMHAIAAGGGGAGIKDGPSRKADKAKSAAAAEEDEGETFYDAAKKEMGERAARTRAALDALDPEQRVAMEGHRPGAYLRLRFTGAKSCPEPFPIHNIFRGLHKCRWPGMKACLDFAKDMRQGYDYSVLSWRDPPTGGVPPPAFHPV